MLFWVAVSEGVVVGWKQFYFEANLFFDHVSGPDGWRRLREAYPKLTDDQLLDAKEATYNGTLPVGQREKHPNFGFRSEHDGEKTLKDFFVQNGMLDLIPPV